MEEMEKSSNIQGILIAILVGISIFGLLFFSFFTDYKKYVANERVSLYDMLLSFTREIDLSIQSNINLLQGYKAYIRNNPEMNFQDSIDYLDLLLENQDNLIRNVGVLKDTTIIWNYPRENNEKAIGIDLMLQDDQKESVLYTKTYLSPVFVGPVDLVQGGKGFIARIPILLEQKYWGQMSVVLNADEYFEHIESMSNKYNLQYAFYRSSDFPDHILLGDSSVLEKKPIFTDFTILDSRMSLAVIPQEGWTNYKGRLWISLTLSLLISIVLSFLLVFLINTRQKMKNMSIHDPLTNLYNRRFFESYSKVILSRCERTGQSGACVLIDINDFKMINDTAGHKMGDKLLKDIADRLIKGLRGSESVFRMGGDEFVVCLPQIQNRKEIEQMVERIRKMLNFDIPLQDQLKKIVPSIGYAVYPEDGTRVDDILHKADLRMYLDKKDIKKNNFEN